MPAVLTGDFIGSTKAGTEALEQSFALLRESVRTVEGWLDISLRFTRFRGDGWQVLVPDERQSLRVAVALMAGTDRRKGLVKTRVAMGIGSVDSTGNTDLSDGSGEAFVLSGHLLDDLPRNRRLVLSGDGTLSALVTLCDAVVQDWTAARAAAAFPLLAPTPPTQADVADTLEISPQSLADRIIESRLWAIEAAFDAFEGTEPQSGL